MKEIKQMTSHKIIFFIALLILLISCHSDLEDYEYLVDPVITEEDSLNMIVITEEGNPELIIEDIFKMLFKTFKTIERENPDIEISPFRIRWEIKDIGHPKNCLAHYGIPIPIEIDSIPKIIKKEHPEVKLEKWKYGTIGKILHIGSYKEENKSILKLEKFINDNHYTIVSKLEEEYLRGPGFFLEGDPDEYYTIIRYSIKSDSLIYQDSLQTNTVDTLLEKQNIDSLSLKNKN
ncbi:MAG: hypothetical protein U9R41_01760 [Candidatus Marinimicrobia bacterium]|nr:hypothetical protein [Candidatus Neomarinimicrobiota bacterium]